MKSRKMKEKMTRVQKRNKSKFGRGKGKEKC